VGNGTWIENEAQDTIVRQKRNSIINRGSASMTSHSWLFSTSGEDSYMSRYLFRTS
jgi:hypothetical protein